MLHIFFHYVIYVLVRTADRLILFYYVTNKARGLASAVVEIFQVVFVCLIIIRRNYIFRNNTKVTYY